MLRAFTKYPPLHLSFHPVVCEGYAHTTVAKDYNVRLIIEKKMPEVLSN
jgi:hypothetical protein